MSQTLLSYSDIVKRGVGASKVTLWRWERAGQFPRRVVLSPQRVAWIESEIDGWIAARIAARRQPIAA
jgi:prophage regulatory protein